MGSDGKRPITPNQTDSNRHETGFTSERFRDG